MKESKKKTSGSDLAVPGVDLGQLERLLSFMSEHGLEEFEYAHGDLRIRLKKAITPASGTQQLALPASPQVHIHAGAAPPLAAAVAAPAQTSAPVAPPPPAAPPEEQLHIIKSPIVGTFYAGSSPESGPFVHVGDVVESGSTLCIIEAMTLMNEIEADIAGEVVKIMVENGHPVEYGESLFALRPAGKK